MASARRIFVGGVGPQQRTLRAKGVQYLSMGDETCFFSALDRIHWVEGYWGDLDTLTIVARAKLDEECLRDVIGLVYRYRVDLTQLRASQTRVNKKWLTLPTAYWHKRMFPRSPTRKR